MLIKTLGIGAAYCQEPYGYTCNLLNDQILLDCPPQAMTSLRAANINVSQLKAMLISHFDPDHTLGFPLVIPGWPDEETGLPIIGPTGTADYFTQLCKLVGKEHKLKRVQFHELARDKESTISLGDYEITAIPLLHNPESLGYLIKEKQGKSLGCTGDTAWCEGLERLISLSDVIIAEMTFLGATNGKHLGIETDLDRFRKILRPAQRVILTHLEDSVEKYKASLLKVSADMEPFLVAEEGSSYSF